MTTILHVVATLDRGGTEVSCWNLTGALSASGDVVNHVVALKRGGSGIEDALQARSATPIQVLEGGRLARAAQFRRICASLQPDAVVFHFFNLEHVVLAAAARAAGVTRMLSKAGNPAPDPSDESLARKWRVVLAGSRLVRCPVVTSSAWIGASLRDLGAMPAGSTVVHNGCHVDEISRRAAGARSHRADRDIFTIGMVARLDPIKDHESLLSALAIVRKRMPAGSVELRLIGDGPLRRELERQAGALGLSPNVKLMGARKDVPEQLGALDLFVLATTRDEGFGVALIEALASGLPVLASDVPACREVLQDGRLGELVCSTPEDLAEGILRAITSHGPTPPSLDAVREAYDVASMARRYRAVLFRSGPDTSAPSQRSLPEAV